MIKWHSLIYYMDLLQTIKAHETHCYFNITEDYIYVHLIMTKRVICPR